MLTRTLTPERWLISAERRASCEISATSSSMYGGSSATGWAASGNDTRSCRMMAISSAIVCG